MNFQMIISWLGLIIENKSRKIGVKNQGFNFEA